MWYEKQYQETVSQSRKYIASELFLSLYDRVISSRPLTVNCLNPFMKPWSLNIALLVFCLPLFFSSITPANFNSLFTFLAPHITAPYVLTLTTILNFLLNCCMSSAAAHVRATAFPCRRGVALPSRGSQGPAGFASSAVVWRRVKGNEVTRGVTFPSFGPENMFFWAFVADHVDNVVVLFLKKCSHFSELT